MVAGRVPGRGHRIDSGPRSPVSPDRDPAPQPAVPGTVNGPVATVRSVLCALCVSVVDVAVHFGHNEPEPAIP